MMVNFGSLTAIIRAKPSRLLMSPESNKFTVRFDLDLIGSIVIKTYLLDTQIKN